VDIKTTLKPGQNGTKRLQEKYGERLACVRYRYDEATSKRYTTVELIEEEVVWAGTEALKSRPPSPAADQLLGVRVEYWETDLRDKVKATGAIWRRRQKLWEMHYGGIVSLGLESRVVGSDGKDSGMW